VSAVGQSTASSAGELVEGRYQLLRPLGAGAQATVWRARDVFLERDVALKILESREPSSIISPARFQREAAMLARLRSAHLATVYAFGFHQGVPYFAMELIEGPSLFELWQAHVSEKTPMPLARTIEIVATAARALSVAHAQGIVHRDVKPENILVESDTGRVVLVDFGVARDAREESDGRIYGTIEYLAPEVLTGKDASASSDQYALAVLTYELLAGALPFPPGGTWRQARRRPRELPPPSRLRPELAHLDGAILHALSTEPTARYATCLAFGGALVDAISSRTSSVPPADDTIVMPQSAGALRVLVVDDDPLFVKLVTRCLQVALVGIPLAVSRTTDPLAAIEKCRRHMPHLVVLDYAMPGMDGVELLGALKSLPDADHLRAIVVSSTTDEHARGRFAMLGARAFASKPIEFGALVQTFHAVARQNGWMGRAE
jgi:serine/threonine protein kinase